MKKCNPSDFVIQFFNLYSFAIRSYIVQINIVFNEISMKIPFVFQLKYNIENVSGSSESTTYSTRKSIIYFRPVHVGDLLQMDFPPLPFKKFTC